MRMRLDGWRLWALTGLAGALGVAVLHLWVPAEGREHAICLLRRVFGLPCPGCGMTRALAHLAKGEWSEAMADHPLAPLLVLEAAALWTAWGWTVLPARGAGRGFAGLPRPLQTLLADGGQRLLLAHLALFVALWIGRLATGTLPP